jgi:hypothetical protein
MDRYEKTLPVKVGCRVRWTSQSSGFSRVKEGTVIADGRRYLPKREWPEEVFRAAKSRIRFGREAVVPSGVIVRVDKIDDRPLRLPRYYSPVREGLVILEED